MTLFCFRSLQLFMCERDCVEKLRELVWIGESLFETYRIQVKGLPWDGFKSSHVRRGFT